MKRSISKVIAGTLAMVFVGVFAQEFPTKPIKIIVPTSTATTSDLTARLRIGFSNALFSFPMSPNPPKFRLPDLGP